MKRSAAIALLAVLPLLLFVHRVLLEAPDVHGFESFDTTEYFHPTAAYLHDSLREGGLPLWNPYQLAGQPFLALHVPGALYPPNLVVHGLLAPGRAQAALPVFHLAVAGILTWLFAARLGLRKAARFAAGAGYMLSGPLVFGIYNPAYLATMAWLPGLLWAIHGLCSEPGGRWSLALGCFLALAFLGGHSQGFVYGLQLALPYGLLTLFTVARRGQRARPVLLAIASGVLALGLVAPQALPTLELQQQAVRNLEGHSFHDATLHSYTTARVLQGLVGLPATELAHGPQGPLRWSVAWPALGLPLFLCGLWAPRMRAHWIFFALASLAAALFVLGRHSPLYSLYYALPFGDLFRAPGRLSFVYGFCIALCVAIGIEGVQTRLRAAGWDKASVAPALLAAAIAIGMYLRSDLVATHPVLEARNAVPPAALIERLVSDQERPRVLLSELFKESRKRGAAGLATKSGMVHRFFAVPDYEPAIPEAYRRYFGQLDPMWHGKLEATPHGPSLGELRRQLDMMSVRYFVAPTGKGAERAARQLGARKLARFETATLFERRSALPHAYSVSRAIAEPNIERAITRIAAPGFQPRREAVVEGLDPRGPGASLLRAATATGRAHDSVKIESYAPEKVVLSAECARVCLVILTDLFYPGWRAYVDGQEQTVYRVNTLFRAVTVQPGPRRIVYRFEPTSLRIGTTAAAATGLIVAAVLAVAFARRVVSSRPSVGPVDDER